MATRQFMDTIVGRRQRAATLRLAKEGRALVGVGAELMAQNSERARRISKPARDVGRGFLIDEKGAQSLILALQRRLRSQEEAGQSRRC
jgi:hypothetical protein